MTPTVAVIISGAGFVVSVVVAIVAASRHSGKVEARMDEKVSALQRDVQRLDEQKASKESHDGLRALLERFEGEMQRGFREIKDLIREVRSESTNPGRR